MNRLSVNIKRVTYHGQSQPALEAVRFVLNDDEILLITGATGSGKTTLLRCLNGIIPKVIPSHIEGEIIWNTVPVNLNVEENGYPRSANVLQNVFHSYISILNRDISPENSRKIDRRWILDGIEKAASFQDLSAGERQRLVLAQVFTAAAPLLLLDEPFTHLDSEGSETLRDALIERKRREEGITLIVEHRTKALNDIIDEQIHLQPSAEGESAFNLEIGNEIQFPSGKYSSNDGIIASLKDVGYKINGKYLFRNLNLNLISGQVVGLYGRNGVGKTTLGKIIAGIISPSEGKIVSHYSKLKTGILLENPQKQLICDTVEDEIRFPAVNYNLPPEYPDCLLESFKLYSHRRKKVRYLSYGLQERTALAAALGNDPELIILDEPLQGQDLSSAGVLSALITGMKKSGKSLIIISHNVDFLTQVSDVVYLLSKDGLTAID